MGGSVTSAASSDDAGHNMLRSSSQTSGASSKGNKSTSNRNLESKHASKSSSNSSLKRDPSLTSFPSLSPEHVSKAKNATDDPATPQPSRTISQKTRDRKKTLASLTNASPYHGQTSLFDDSPRSSMDIPGALHLASNEHIERLIARAGAVKLVRQFAQDLAQRDEELSALRARADERERELKKMLREADVPSTIIENRLREIEIASLPGDGLHSDARPGNGGAPKSRIGSMMYEAMLDEVGAKSDRAMGEVDFDPSATVRPAKMIDKEFKSPGKSGSATDRQLRNSNVNSARNSRSSSIFDDSPGVANDESKIRTASSTFNRRGLDNIFQSSGQSNSYFIGGVNKTIKKPLAGDDVSVHSQKSSKSMMSWTKIFAGNPVGGKGEMTRPRSASLEQQKQKAGRKSAAAEEPSSMARVKTIPQNILSGSQSHTSLTSAGTVKARNASGRTTTSSTMSTSPDHFKSDPDVTSLGPVEMDAILPMDSKPPTMQLTSNNYQSEGLLTDRFGFIYDQRQRKRQRQAAAGNATNGLSAVESIRSYRQDSNPGDDQSPVKTNGHVAPTKKPTTSTSTEDDAQPKAWTDYLKVPARLSTARPTELLSHAPSAGAVVTVNAVDVTDAATPRRGSISIKSQHALPMTSLISAPSQSNVTATTPTLANNQNPAVTTPPSDKEPVKLLLEQLTELHDTLQAEREVKFNDFLRKVRAERTANLSTDRASNNAPEADLPNGELIGNLGHPKNRSKYLQFKTLVLSGIPVSLRPKIWAECSGAASLRIPGYYDDLLTKSHSDDEMDVDIAQQIAADIGRTLTDNTFFRYGPGRQRLSEILRAYSLHNPSVGYCQGMNLITASLLLICATSEDVFWLLVAVVDKIMPSGYFDRGLLVSRADQAVLRGYVAELLPKLDARLHDLGVELEACTFQWFLSLFTAVVSAEALYRIWDVILTLNSSDAAPAHGSSHAPAPSASSLTVPALPSLPATPTTIASIDLGAETEHDGTSSPFLFQLSLALLKLNEPALLALESPAAVYQYVNHNMTNHAISIDALIAGAEALRVKIRREDVLARRRKAVAEIR